MHDHRNSIAPGIALAAIVTVGLASLYILPMVRESSGRTIAMLVAVVVSGLVLIRRLSRRLGDVRLLRLRYVFLFKILLVLFLLRVGWVPMLSPESESFGYDPQRYYFDALRLIDGGFSPAVVGEIGMYYSGVVYYYATILFVAGRNPVVPALLNVFVTLIAVGTLIRVGYGIKLQRGRNDWWLGLGMVLPEVIWFDVMTARETLVMSLLTIVTLSVGEALILKPREPLSLPKVTVILAALVLIGVVRTSMLLPVTAAIILVLVVPGLPVRRRAPGLVIVSALLVVLVLAPRLMEQMGSIRFDYLKLAQAVSSGSQSIDDADWSKRSLGRLLASSTMGGVAVTSVPRLFLYLVAPFPAPGFQSAALAAGAWNAWQDLMLACSAGLNVLLLPLAVASLIAAVRARTSRSGLVFQIPCWVTLLAVAAGNQIIHERYRVMASLLLWGCIWLGFSAPRRLIAWAYWVWFGAVAFAGTFYVAYKAGVT